MKLPNSENAFIDLRKLERYCFNPEHVDGKHKAYLFSKLLGFTENNIEEMRSILLDFAQNDEVVRTMPNEYGMTYSIDSAISKHERTFKIRSNWIIRENENFPRFVTCYIKRKKDYNE